MATKYTILETAHTEESDPFSSKGKAVEAAEAAAEEYPGTTFMVATGKGTVVHKALAESVDVPADTEPVDDVPEVQGADEEPVDFDTTLAEVVAGESLEPELDEDVDADFEPESDTDIETDPSLNGALARIALAAVADNPADTEEDNTPGDKAEDAGQDGAEEDNGADDEEPPHHGLEVVSAEDVVKALAAQEPAPAAPATPVAAPAAAPAGATLELCAANTNAKRMHYRVIGEQRTACGSANTSRRANAHQIETASLCPNCEKLADGKVVDDRPAGAGRGTGSRKSPKRLVVDAGEIRDLVAHLKQGIPYPMELADGTRIEVVGGDPASKELDEPEKDNLSDVRSINIVSS